MHYKSGNIEKSRIFNPLIWGGNITGCIKSAWRASCAVIFALCIVPAAHADIATVNYVNDIVAAIKFPQADWSQTNSNSPDYIKNKPYVPVDAELEHISNKVNTISDTATDTQYPTARAVSDALATKADADDIKFDSIPTTQPAGTPAPGRVFIWFN